MGGHKMDKRGTVCQNGRRDACFQNRTLFIYRNACSKYYHTFLNMNRLTGKRVTGDKYYNPHAQKQGSSFLMFFLAVLGVFCLYCIYTIDYRGHYQNVQGIFHDTTLSVGNYSIASFYNSTKLFGEELAKDLGQSATIAHFHQYNFTQAMSQVWNSITHIFSKLIQSSSAAELQTKPEKTSTTEKAMPTAEHNQETTIAEKEISCDKEEKGSQCNDARASQEQSRQNQDATSPKTEENIVIEPVEQPRQQQLQEPQSAEPVAQDASKE